MEKEKQKLEKKFSEYAGSKGYKMQDNKDMLDTILTGFIKKKDKYGEYYCPCRVPKGNEEDKDIICPCAFHEDEIKKDKHCKCFLFFSE